MRLPIDTNSIKFAAAGAAEPVVDESKHEVDVPPTVVLRDVKGRSEMQPLLLTVPQAAQTLGISRTSMYELLNRGLVRSVHLGASRRIPMTCITEFIDRLLNGER